MDPSSRFIHGLAGPIIAACLSLPVLASKPDGEISPGEKVHYRFELSGRRVGTIFSGPVWAPVKPAGDAEFEAVLHYPGCELNPGILHYRFKLGEEIDKARFPDYPIPLEVRTMVEITGEQFAAAKAVEGAGTHDFSIPSCKTPDAFAERCRTLLFPEQGRVRVAMKEIQLYVREIKSKKSLPNGYPGASWKLDRKPLAGGIPADSSPQLLVSYTSARTGKTLHYQFDLTGRC